MSISLPGTHPRTVPPGIGCRTAVRRHTRRSGCGRNWRFHEKNDGALDMGIADDAGKYECGHHRHLRRNQKIHALARDPSAPDLVCEWAYRRARDIAAGRGRPGTCDGDGRPSRSPTGSGTAGGETMEVAPELRSRRPADARSRASIRDISQTNLRRSQRKTFAPPPIARRLIEPRQAMADLLGGRPHLLGVLGIDQHTTHRVRLAAPPNGDRTNSPDGRWDLRDAIAEASRGAATRGNGATTTQERRVYVLGWRRSEQKY